MGEAPTTLSPHTHLWSPGPAGPRRHQPCRWGTQRPGIQCWRSGCAAGLTRWALPPPPGIEAARSRSVGSRGAGRGAGSAFTPCTAVSPGQVWAISPSHRREHTLPSTGAWGRGSINPLHLLLLHLDFVTHGRYFSPACGGGGRGWGKRAVLTSLGVPPLEGLHTIRYLRGGRGAGLQDKRTLEEVTWVRTSLVGAGGGSRAGVAVGGRGVQAQGVAGVSGSACAPWRPLPGRTGGPQLSWEL